MRRSALALASAAVVCAIAVAPASSTASSPPAHRASTKLLGGVNLGSVAASSLPAEADRLVALAQQLHVGAVRLEVPWAVLEPRAAGVIEARPLAYMDRLVADAAAKGIRTILLVEGSPCWASSAPASLLRKCGKRGGVSKAAAWPPKEPSTYGAFVAYLAQRYGANLAAIEIWNEPDQANEDYFAGPEKPVRYAALLRAAYTAIKAVKPTVPVLAGSLVGSNGVFLRALYAAGIKGYYDGLAVHFYNLTLASVRSIHEVQLSNGDSKPLWLDEFGWSSCWPRKRTQQEQACVTEQTQASNLTNTFRELARTSYVAAAVVYKLQDSTEESFGLLTAAGKRKPAFAAFSRALASPLGSISPTTLSLRARGGHVVASGSAAVGDFMQLEAFQGSVLRYRALFTLDRFDRYSISLPSVLGTSGLRVRVFQYWSGVGNSAQRTI